MLICPACSRRFVDTFGRCSEDGTPLVPDRTPLTLAPGTKLDGGLTVQQLVGAGPTGEVYAAEYQRQLVAVKVLAPDLAGDPVFAKQLVRLLGHLSKVRHPGVAGVLTSDELSPRQPLVVRELVTGRSLSEYIRHTGPLPVSRALPIAMKVAEALTEAHRSGALHLALKPSNVFVSDADDVKLVDFGIGQRIVIPGPVPRLIHGDPQFLAPEQFEGKLVSFRSDIYGLGTILYFLLTGRPLFAAMGPDAERVVATQRPPPPSSLAPGLAGMIKLDQVVLRALEKVPAKRYLSVQHFGRMMDGVLQELTGGAQLGGTGRPGVPLEAQRTVPMNAYPNAAPQRAARPGPVGPVVAAPVIDDTLRMQVSPDGLDAAGLDGPTIRERPPRMVPGTAGRGFGPAAVQMPPRRPDQDYLAAGHDTIRAVVAPVPMRPPDTQPIPTRNLPESPRVGAVAEQRAAAGYDDIGIEVVEEDLFPQARKKKKRKKPQAPPVIAVRSEAALLLGPSAGSFRRATDPGQAVLLDQQFLEEVRGPERNLATMEIRVRPAPDAAIEVQAAEQPRARATGSSTWRVGRWVLAAFALIFLFVLAAAGAAVLARWLSSRASELPGGPPPPAASATP
jgi:serine/threonine-protein kinase